MTEIKYSIFFPKEECRDSTIMKLEACQEAHAKIHKRVLGHDRREAEWIVFDDCLTMAYDQMQRTLKMLDEKAG